MYKEMTVSFIIYNYSYKYVGHCCDNLVPVQDSQLVGA